MSELRSILTAASSKSLVLVDEICRGTETGKGTCIAGSIVERLDKIGCLGVVSTHLHGLFDLPLDTRNTVYKAMGAENVDGQTKPTWKLTDGICRESLAFETAKREGIPEMIIGRAEELYFSTYARTFSSGGIETKVGKLCFSKDTNSPDVHFQLNDTEARGIDYGNDSIKTKDIVQKDIEKAISMICGRVLLEQKHASNIGVLKCVAIGAREQPPPSTIGASCVYVMLRPDKRLYVGVVCFHSISLLFYSINFT